MATLSVPSAVRSGDRLRIPFAAACGGLLTLALFWTLAALVDVVAANPANVFEDAALKAIARWRYQPKIEGGAAVERVGLQTVFRFDLDRQ